MEEVGSGALGLVLVFLGFCAAVMAIKGTYVETMHALTTPATSTTTKGTS